MPKTFLRSLLVALASVSLAGPAAAAVIGGFETGALDGFTTIGNVYRVDDSFGGDNPQGAWSLFMSTFPNGDGLLGPLSGSAIDQAPPPAEPTANVESFLGLSAGDLDAISPGAGNPTTEGSAAQVTFTIAATFDLSMQVLLMSNETDTWAPNFTDFFFTTLTGEGAVQHVNVTDDPLSASNTIFDRDTGWITVSWSGLAPGTYTLGIGIMDVQDTDLGSAVLVDNIVAVPQPRVAWLLGLGLGGIWLAGYPPRRRD